MMTVKRQSTLLMMSTIAFFLLTVTWPAIAQLTPSSEENEIMLIQATLLMARLEQPGLPRYQFSQKEYDLVYSAFGNMNGLSAKFIKVVPMNPVTGSDPKKTGGWVMEIGDAWGGLFQVEKIERVYNKPQYKTWPIVEFRRGRILFLENGLQVSENLEARISKRMYIFKKDQGWISNKEEKK